MTPAGRIPTWLMLGVIAVQSLAQPALADVETGASSSGWTQEEQVTEARRTYQQALQQFDSGEFRAALAGFLRAYELAPSFHILYNIAVVHVALEDAAAAMEAFEQYLREGEDRIPSERQTEVDRELAELSRRVAWLDVRVNQTDARIWIDEREVGRAPLSDRIRLNAGAHRVRVGIESDYIEEQIVRLQSGEERVVTFQLHSVEPPATKPILTEPVHDQVAPAQPPWLAWGVTGALAVSTGVVGLGAMRRAADERAVQDTQGVTASELQHARRNVQSWALATDILLAATAVGAGVSLYLTLRPPKHGRSDTALIVGPGSMVARYEF